MPRKGGRNWCEGKGPWDAHLAKVGGNGDPGSSLHTTRNACRTDERGKGEDHEGVDCVCKRFRCEKSTEKLSKGRKEDGAIATTWSREEDDVPLRDGHQKNAFRSNL